VSIVRFGTEGSNVYVFISADGIECCGCGLVGTVTFDALEPAILHLLEHRAAGHCVPGWVGEVLAHEWGAWLEEVKR
jgi:hypothetical protein